MRSMLGAVLGDAGEPAITRASAQTATHGCLRKMENGASCLPEVRLKRGKMLRDARDTPRKIAITVC